MAFYKINIIGRRTILCCAPVFLYVTSVFSEIFRQRKTLKAASIKALSVGAPDRNRTCTFFQKYGPEPYASASSATGACFNFWPLNFTRRGLPRWSISLNPQYIQTAVKLCVSSNKKESKNEWITKNKNAGNWKAEKCDIVEVDFVNFSISSHCIVRWNRAENFSF